VVKILKMKFTSLKSLLKENLDASSSLNKRIFEKIGIRDRPEVNKQLEEEEKENRWEVISDPTRLIRKYKFPDYRVLQEFVIDVLDFQGDLNHHGTLHVNPDEVIVEVYTHDINDITEVDHEYSKIVEEIYLDVKDRKSKW
tara:strand:+ start:1869 stop:2291 length:423 start_codon:yes stop_codon:yes gene_type:complete